jgi:predicted AAA+ superfamily ATPase
MYIQRQITDKLHNLLQGFPVVYLTGPRQSGKSTLLKHAYPSYTYLNLEEVDTRNFALDDPRGFLAVNGDRVIIDEAQRAPELFSYIQARVDKGNAPGTYILSGSQNFLMLRSISQSLAGRVGILTLLPLSLQEMAQTDIVFADKSDWLWTGGYPRIKAFNIAPNDFYPNYLETYVERDIRTETGVHDLGRFKRFMAACAARVGTPINLSDIARDLSADARTISSWLSILEESYIAFRMNPWYGNLGKRQTKKPKLYFYDTGLLCSLLGITHPQVLVEHGMRGFVFENAVISELAKSYHNAGQRPPFFFWRDKDDHDKEVDLLIEHHDGLELIEVKSSQTANAKYTFGIRGFTANNAVKVKGSYVVYDGYDNLRLSQAEFVNWRNLHGFDPA